MTMAQQQANVNGVRREIARTLQVWQESGAGDVAQLGLLQDADYICSDGKRSPIFEALTNDETAMVKNLAVLLCRPEVGAWTTRRMLTTILLMELGRNLSAHDDALEQLVEHHHLPLQRVLDVVRRKGGGAPAAVWTVPEYSAVFKSGGIRFLQAVQMKEEGLSDQEERDAREAEQGLNDEEFTLTNLIWGAR